MKREEAIKMIQDDMRLHHDYLSGKYRKALRMAVEALSDRPHGEWNATQNDVRGIDICGADMKGGDTE